MPTNLSDATEPRYITRETGLVERVCKHGVGHPTSESAAKLAKKYGHSIGTWMTHGCDGCCVAWEGV